VVADTLRATPLPVLALRPADFELPIAAVRRCASRPCSTTAPAFAIVDRLPLDRLRREEAVAVFWLAAPI
jgi:hypothetical protein